jgi:hypothetical protein
MSPSEAGIAPGTSHNRHPAVKAQHPLTPSPSYKSLIVR